MHACITPHIQCCQTLSKHTCAPPGQPQQHWYAFYQVKNLESFKGEIGVAMSADQGVSWQHLGIALSEPYPLSSPFVTYDEASGQYVMIPDSHRSGSYREPQVVLYTTHARQFPFGWQPAKVGLAGLRYADTTAIRLQELWYIFTTVKDHGPWNDQAHYELHLFTAAGSLLSNWTEHPSSPITSDPRYARSGGRPFLYEGKVHRWAQDDSVIFGESLHLFKLGVLSPQQYMESYVKSLKPSGPKGDWSASRTHHVDLQQLGGEGGNGSWYGLVDGDRYRDGKRHFYQHEARFVRLKVTLRQAMTMQLALTLFVWLAWHLSSRLTLWVFGVPGSELRLSRTLVMLWRACVPEAALLAAMLVAMVLTFAAFVLAPSSLFYCPRWSVLINVHETPPVTHVDPAAPYSTSDVVVVTAATAAFFDRMQNMIGSIHTWEPEQKVRPPCRFAAGITNIIYIFV